MIFLGHLFRPYVVHSRTLPPIEELFLTLISLQLGLMEQDLAYHFQISQSTVSRIIFHDNIVVLVIAHHYFRAIFSRYTLSFRISRRHLPLTYKCVSVEET